MERLTCFSRSPAKVRTVEWMKSHLLTFMSPGSCVRIKSGLSGKTATFPPFMVELKHSTGIFKIRNQKHFFTALCLNLSAPEILHSASSHGRIYVLIIPTFVFDKDADLIIVKPRAKLSLQCLGWWRNSKCWALLLILHPLELRPFLHHQKWSAF